MACDFCEGKTCLFKSEFKLWIEDGMLCVGSRFNSIERHDINNCPMCGDDIALKRKEGENDGEVH